jgi:5'-3' exonuclease
MINIAIDGNHHFHKTFGVFAGYGNMDPGKVLKEKSEQAAFIRKVSTDLCASLKMLPQGGRMVFTADSRSWRKDVEIENGGYKSGRVKDETTDWTIFFELMAAFGEQLEKMGFIFSRVDGAEGDDLLMFWSDYFNLNGENCLIIRGDYDMHQLARKNDKAWTAVWNTNSKKNMLSVHQKWEELWLNKNESVGMSIFNMSSAISPEKDKFKEFLKKVKIEEIDSYAFIFHKVLIGDDGDSVPSVWDYAVKNKDGEDKIVRFTDSKAKKVYAALVESEWMGIPFDVLVKNNEFLNWISGLVLRTTKDVDATDNRKKVALNFERNLILMWLNYKVIPPFVIKGASQEILRGMEMQKKNVTLDRIKILEGSEWVTTGYQPKGFDPFSYLQ